MGIFAKDPKKVEQEPGGGSGLEIDLDERACPRCRRMLHPWEPVCPDDGSAGVDRASLPRTDLPPPPAHLLTDEADDADEAGDGSETTDDGRSDPSSLSRRR